MHDGFSKGNKCYKLFYIQPIRGALIFRVDQSQLVPPNPDQIAGYKFAARDEKAREVE